MTVSNTRLSLPGRGLLVVWLLLVMATVLGWGLVAGWLGVSERDALWAMVGGLLALTVCGGALMLITPWRDHPASELPTLWLLVTVVRLLATPMVALLLYFAAHPPADFYVVGLACCFLGVLFFETPLIALDVRRQIVDLEREQDRQEDS